jgi:hypothetical protein
MTAVFYKPTRDTRKLFAYIPNGWIWPGELLLYNGDRQNFVIPSNPSPSGPINGPEAVPVSKSFDTFTIELQYDRRGRLELIPIYLVVEGHTALVNHDLVATFPHSREYVK